MLRIYEEKRILIQDELVAIGETVINSLELALKAIKNDNLEDMKGVTVSYNKLIKQTTEIDNLIIKALALYSPEAKDLRELVSYLKITNELSRAGGNTKDFLKLFRKSFTEDLNKNTILEYAIPLLKSTILSLKTAISMIKDTDMKQVEEKYQRVVVEESKTDDLYAMVEKNILKLVTKKLDLSKEYFDTLTSLRKLAKTSDRAVSIANLILFAEVGGEL